MMIGSSNLNFIHYIVFHFTVYILPFHKKLEHNLKMEVKSIFWNDFFVCTNIPMGERNALSDKKKQLSQEDYENKVRNRGGGKENGGKLSVRFLVY